MFHKDWYSKSEAQAWAKSHGFKFRDVDEGGRSAKFYHLRQFEPDEASSGFGTITFKTKDGVGIIKARVAVPKWRAEMGPARLKRGVKHGVKRGG